MMFTRVYTLALFFLTFGLISSASPSTTSIKRQEAAVQTVFETLKASTDTILPQFDAIVAAGNITDTSDLAPVFALLTGALDTASASLGGISVIPALKRQSDDELANLIAGIITDITNALTGVFNSAAGIPGLDTLLAGVDTSLNQVLRGLQILLQGVLNLVATLLTDVANLLRRLALGLSLGTLGI